MAFGIPAQGLALTLALAITQGPSPAKALWFDITAGSIGETALWTNKVEIADVNGDGRPDLLFANGGNYSEPGKPEPNQVFINNGPGKRFTEKTAAVFGPAPDLARVIKARDFNGDGITDIVVGTTFQTQSRLYLGTGGGVFHEVTASHLPLQRLSVGDIEPGDVDGDGDLDLVLADWGLGDNMSNDGGRTRLWLNDGTAHFTDATEARMPATRIRFSWDLEFIDVDNDADLDIVVSSKRGGGGSLFKNDGAGRFTEDTRALPQYTNNYEYEPMDLDGDGFLDLVTINDGEILSDDNSNRREHVLRNDGKGRFKDATAHWWSSEANIGEDDNMVAFLDYDSDGDADFVIGSLSGPDRLIINDGKGHLTLRRDVFDGPETPGTLAIALADLDGDGRMDVVQAQGEHPTAVQERVYSGRGLDRDTAPPSITMISTAPSPTTTSVKRLSVRARIHDRKSPSLATDWRSVTIEWIESGKPQATPMIWYGEYLFRATMPATFSEGTPFQVCATDGAGNRACETMKKAVATLTTTPTPN